MANFLDLPPELRNVVYKLVIKTGKTIDLEDPLARTRDMSPRFGPEGSR